MVNSFKNVLLTNNLGSVTRSGHAFCPSTIDCKELNSMGALLHRKYPSVEIHDETQSADCWEKANIECA